MAKVSFRLVMPEREVLATEADMVVVPGSEGDFGVLHGHAPLISTVRPGVLEVLQGNKVEQRFIVVGGFAEVTPERCTVLADEAVPPEDLDRAQLEAELQTIDGNMPMLRDQIGHATGTDREHLLAELRQLERQFAVTSAKLRVLRDISG
jgi:ATP synthase F1 epsilon subunit